MYEYDGDSVAEEKRNQQKHWGIFISYREEGNFRRNSIEGKWE